jgi:hypothetical protein
MSTCGLGRVGATTDESGMWWGGRAAWRVTDQVSVVAHDTNGNRLLAAVPAFTGCLS